MKLVLEIDAATLTGPAHAAFYGAPLIFAAHVLREATARLRLDTPRGDLRNHFDPHLGVIGRFELIDPQAARAAPLADLRCNDAARAATGVDGISAGAMLETGVVLVRRALAAWASGDLAAAINGLEEWAGDVESNFPALDYDDGDESDVEADAVGLPPGYTLEADSDGDWLLVPPEGVTIFGEPGEGWIVTDDYMKGRDYDSRADVLAAALDYLAAIGEPAPNPTPWTVTDDEAKPIAVLGRFATEDEGAALIDTLDGAQRERGGYGLTGPADD